VSQVTNASKIDVKQNCSRIVSCSRGLRITFWFHAAFREASDRAVQGLERMKIAPRLLMNEYAFSALKHKLKMRSKSMSYHWNNRMRDVAAIL
jgi:hypothetical protein